MRFIALPQERVIQQQSQIARGKFERHFLVLPKKLASLHLDSPHREREEPLDWAFAGGVANRGRGRIGSAVGVVDDVHYRMVEQQRVQADIGAEQRNDLELSLHAVNAEKWRFAGSFTAVDGEVAALDAQAKRDGVQFAEFDSASSSFLKLGDQSAAHALLERVRAHIPPEQRERDRAEYTKTQK